MSAVDTEIVDLCDDEEDSKPAASRGKDSGVIDLSQRQPRRKRKRICAAMNSSTKPTPDAICLDESVATTAAASTLPSDPVARYRRVLGPLRMGFVESFENHAFAKSPQSPRFPTNQIYRELVEYQLNLPIERSSSVFVRAMESRLDLLRVLITGPEGTPYAFGCFVFDVFLDDYPQTPPKVKFVTTQGGKARFNPNLYNCGKVCLSLLGTWQGPGWIPNQSTLLQVLVSIQGLILVPEPLYNEPGFGEPGPENKFSHQSRVYNAKGVAVLTAGVAIREFLREAYLKNHYPEFEAVVIAHFSQTKEAIEAQLDAWLAENKRFPKEKPVFSPGATTLSKTTVRAIKSELRAFVASSNNINNNKRNDANSRDRNSASLSSNIKNRQSQRLQQHSNNIRGGLNDRRWQQHNKNSSDSYYGHAGGIYDDYPGPIRREGPPPSHGNYSPHSNYDNYGPPPPESKQSRKKPRKLTTGDEVIDLC